MKILNLLNPIKNTLDRLATASISNPIAATSLTISSSTANYRNSTTESTVYLPRWTKIQGGADLLPNGPGSSLSLNLSTTWGSSIRHIIETTGTLYTIGSSETVTISTMVGGTGTIHSSVVNQTTPQNEGFQMISGTYGATALAAYIGQTAKIRIASPDANTIGNRIIFYNIAQMTSVSDTTPPTLTSFEGNKSGGPILVNEPVNYTVTFSKPMSACS